MRQPNLKVTHQPSAFAFSSSPPTFIAVQSAYGGFGSECWTSLLVHHGFAIVYDSSLTLQTMVLQLSSNLHFCKSRPSMTRTALHSVIASSFRVMIVTVLLPLSGDSECGIWINFRVRWCSPNFAVHLVCMKPILAPRWKSLLFDFPKCLPTNLIFSSLVAGDLIPFVAELESGCSGGSGGLSILQIIMRVPPSGGLVEVAT